MVTIFYFLRGSIILNMMPFDGQNSDSILVTDNCSADYVMRLLKLILSDSLELSSFHHIAQSSTLLKKHLVTTCLSRDT